MILDNALTLVTPTITAAGTYNSADQIDLQNLRDLGEGREIQALLTITATFTGGTNAEFSLWAADTIALAGATFVAGFGGSLGIANWTAGVQRIVTLPQLFASGTNWGTRYKRYLYLQVVSTGTMTAGAASLSLILDEQDGRTFYPSGYTIA